MSMKTIIINSSKRSVKTDSSSDFKLNFTYPLPQGNYSLKYAYMPNTIETIDERNDTFVVDGVTITLSHGNYTSITDLITELNLATGNVFTITQSHNILTFSKATPFVLDFRDKALARLIGFNQVLYDSQLSFTGSGWVNFAANSIGMNIIIDQHCNTRDNTHNAFTFRIPTTSGKNKYSADEPKMWYQTFTLQNDKRTISIRVVDDDSRTVSLGNVDWWIVLEKSF